MSGIQQYIIEQLINVMNEALNNEELDLFKKANLALRYLSLIKGKDDIMQKSSDNLFRYTL